VEKDDDGDEVSFAFEITHRRRELGDNMEVFTTKQMRDRGYSGQAHHYTVYHSFLRDDVMPLVEKARSWRVEETTPADYCPWRSHWWL